MHTDTALANEFRSNAGSLDSFLESLGLEQYLENFKSNHIDETLILEVNDLELERIGVSSLGHRKALLARLEEIKHAATSKSIEVTKRKASRGGMWRFMLGSLALGIIGFLMGLALSVAFSANPGANGETIDPHVLASVIAVLTWGLFLPTIIASARRHPRAVAIFLANLFFGATGAGWLICFFWSLGGIDAAEAGGLAAVAASQGRLRR